MLRLFLISVACFVFAFGCAPVPMPKLDFVEPERRECERIVDVPMSSYIGTKSNACKAAGVDISGITNFWTFFDKCLHFFNPDLTINLGALETFYREMGRPLATSRDCAAKIKGSSLEDAAKKLIQCEKS